jgi:uncharacterized protein YndB with AHSA1/START domain
VADTYVVERKTSIAAPPAEVFSKVVDLREWDAWSPWEGRDPNMTKTYTGDPGAVGSRYHWKGNRKVGEGQMTIADVDAPNKVAIDLEFIKPFKSQSLTEISFEPAGDGTEVTWHMTGNHTWMSKIMGVFRSMDKMIGPDFEQGLASLKSVSE